MSINKAQLIKLKAGTTVTIEDESFEFRGWKGTKCINHGTVILHGNDGEEEMFVSGFLEDACISTRDDEANAEVEAALKVLFKHANVMGSDGIISSNFAVALQGEHRTIQQTFIREIKSGIEKYAEDNANYTDARNEGGVKWAQAVASIGEKHYLPYV